MRSDDMAVKWDINLGTITTVIMALSGAGLWVNTQLTSLDLRVSQSEQYRVARSAQTDKNFVDLGSLVRSLGDGQLKQGQQVDTLGYRMGQMESTVSASNARMDRIADSVLSSVEGIKKDVNSVNTQVQLLGQKVDSLDVPRSPLKKGAWNIRPLWFEGQTQHPVLRTVSQSVRPFP